MQRILRETGFSVLRTDVKQGWSERPITGRSMRVTAARYSLKWPASRLNLPYEVVVLAETQ
jgi:hypothetical protein